MVTPIERADSATSIYDFMRSSAEAYGADVAFRCGPMTLSFTDALSQGRALAAYLQANGVAKGDRVALMTPNLPGLPYRDHRHSNGRCRAGQRQSALHSNGATPPTQRCRSGNASTFCWDFCGVCRDRAGDDHSADHSDRDRGWYAL